MRTSCAAFSLALAAALAGCTTSEGPTGGPASALPSPPPGQLAPITDAVRELYGEWRPLSGPGVSEKDRLTIWSPMFSWGSGCNVSQGQLRDLGEHRFTIEHGFGRLPENCRSLSPLAPFDGADVLIVRMPPLTGKSRLPVITPEPGAEVLLLASRTGYIAGRLFEGSPPSSDTRVVHMTLPLMRIVEGKLAEAVDGANVLGAAAFAGTSVDDARELARSVEEAMKAIAPPRPAYNFGNPTVRRFFITKIGDRQLPDPTRLWIEYDFGGPRGNGDVTAYFDGCTPVGRMNMDGKSSWVASAIACPGNLPDGSPITERAVAEAVRWIEENYFPDIICVSTCPEYPEYTVPLRGGEVIMRAMLQ